MSKRTLKYREAISEALAQSMAADPDVFITGIGVDDIKGAFGTTSEAFHRFGSERVFDVPNCENAMAGALIGAAAMGKRPVWVHPRNDFMFLATDQLINLAAKWKYMYGHTKGVPLVIRGIIGRGWGQGATHSQSLQALFAHFPGLYVAMPSTPGDVKGLLVSALRGDVPVILLEHRALYEMEGEVPEEMVEVPFGRGAVVQGGNDVTIVATSAMVFEAKRASELVRDYGISFEIIDPRSIRPLDVELIVRSVRKTGRLVVVDTSWAHCGFSAEVAAVVAENCHEALKAPVRRVTTLDCPAPVSKPLEEAFHPNAHTIVETCLRLLKNDARIQKRLPDLQAHFAGPY